MPGPYRFERIYTGSIAGRSSVSSCGRIATLQEPHKHCIIIYNVIKTVCQWKAVYDEPPCPSLVPASPCTECQMCHPAAASSISQCHTFAILSSACFRQHTRLSESIKSRRTCSERSNGPRWHNQPAQVNRALLVALYVQAMMCRPSQNSQPRGLSERCTSA